MSASLSMPVSRSLRLGLLLGLLGLCAGALPVKATAQERKAEPKERIEYEKKTVINFDDDTIQGDLTRPDGEYVEARRKVGHQSLIKIREDWRDKVKQAAAEL